MLGWGRKLERRVAQYGHTEIRTDHLLNTSLQRNCYTNLHGGTSVLLIYINLLFVLTSLSVGHLGTVG